MGSLAIAILLVATSPAAPEPDPLFETSPACAVEADALFAEADRLLAPAAPPASPEPRSQSLSQAAESRIRDEDPSRSIAIQVERLTAPATAPSHRLASPGRAWPFALAATADAATTYWALGRGGAERNPLLAMGRLDVGMVKMAQFPLLAKAVDLVEGKNPRLGRRLRWTTLIFHAVLAANNVRLGRFAAQRERMTRASGTP